MLRESIDLEPTLSIVWALVTSAVLWAGIVQILAALA